MIFKSFNFLKQSVVNHSELLFTNFIKTLLHGVEWLFDKDALNMTGQTPHEVIFQKDLMSVLHYYPLKEKEIKIAGETIKVEKEKRFSTPLVYIPPLLAPGFAFDIFPERSLVRYFLAKGFDVYLIDFGSPDKSHSHLSFENYVIDWIPVALKKIREIGEQKKLSLFGYCMGGLFCLLYTALFNDKNIKNIITVGSPIDMHQMGAAGKLFSIVAIPSHKLARRLHLNLRDINPKYMHVPGVLGTIGFHLTNPLGGVKKYFDLLLNLWDRDFIIAQESLGHWINNLLDYPGATMREIIIQMALQNKLARKGKMRVGSENAELKNIYCSLLSFAGNDDKIVPANSAHKIMEIVSSEDKEFHTVPGGHVGVIIGNQAPSHLWKIAERWLSQRS